jgi:hypothetical protein
VSAVPDVEMSYDASAGYMKPPEVEQNSEE